MKYSRNLPSLEQNPVLLNSVDIEPEMVFVTTTDQNSLHFVNTLCRDSDPTCLWVLC